MPVGTPADLGVWVALPQRVAVAVSGGADSLCLAWLAARHGNVLALIVDHGLRPGAAREAADTAARLATFGVPSHILTLADLAPGPGLAARARQARYAALTAAARQAGCVDLLLGHHRRDQAETVLMRQRAGSGPAGLAGMAAISETHDLRLLRPLLGVPPGVLRDCLRRAGLAWVEDPTNRNPATLRARLRAELDDDRGDGPPVAALALAAGQAGERRAAREAALAAILAERVSIRPEGFALLSPGPIAADALAALIRTIGGSRYPESSAALARLAANPVPCVLGGVRFLPAGRLGEGLLVVREAAAMAAPVDAVPGAVWDGRFRLEQAADWPDGAALGAALGALGAEAAGMRRCSPLPSAVLQTLPALRLKGKLAAVAFIGYPEGGVNARLVVRFAPSNPLAGAPFGVARGGCEVPCEPPC